MNRPIIYHAGKWLLCLAAIAVCLLAMASCNTPGHARRDLVKWQAQQPATVAAGCAAWYPPRDSVAIYTDYRTGKVFFLHDTTWVDCDSVVAAANAAAANNPTNNNPSNKRPAARVPCPADTVWRVDTVVKSEYHQVENTARLAATTARAEQAEAEKKRLRSGRNTWRWIGIAGIALAALWVAWKIWIPKPAIR